MTTLFPIDSARIEIVNRENAGERYWTYTNTSGVWAYTITPTGVGSEPEVPNQLALAQNYPNPFNPSTRIEFAVPAPGRIDIAVYDILGSRLHARSFVLEPGAYSIPWQSTGAAGVLFYSIDMGGKRIVRKMIQLDGGGSGGLGDVTRVHWRTPPAAMAALVEEYTVTASRIGYEPDSMTITLINGVRADFLLETIHNRAFLVDLHNDVLEKVVSGYQLGPRHAFNHSDIPRFRDGGVDAQMFALWADPSQFGTNPYQRVLAMADSFDAQVARNPGTLGHAKTEADIIQLNGQGKIAGILAVEGGHAIENDLVKLRALYARGARYLTITWNNSTAWATSAADPLSATNGLTEFGRTVIRTMDTLGMIIDVSHTGIRTIEDILATTTNPVIATHSGARSLRNHYRNLTDAQLVAIAQTGGVIGVVFYPFFLSSTNSATIDTVIRHIDYIRNLVGVDHIALGSDFDGIEQTPVGLEDVSRFPALTLALLTHGYSPSDVRKINGGNFLRVFSQVCNR
jgi:membrane dipeptidase